MQTALAITELSKTYEISFRPLRGSPSKCSRGTFRLAGAQWCRQIHHWHNLLAGAKDQWQVSIFGCDIDTDFSQAKQYVGVVPQEFNFNQFEKPFDILVNQAGYFGIPREVAAEGREVPAAAGPLGKEPCTVEPCPAV